MEQSSPKKYEEQRKHNGVEAGLPDQSRIEELAEHFDRTYVSDPAEFGEAEDVVIERRPEMAQVSVRIPSEDLITPR